MAIYRDLKGRFFSIPETELEDYRISAADLASCSEERASHNSTSNSHGDGSTIVVNQFFAAVDQVPAGIQRDPNLHVESRNDFAAQYTYPNAWGTK